MERLDVQQVCISVCDFCRDWFKLEAGVGVLACPRCGNDRRVLEMVPKGSDLTEGEEGAARPVSDPELRVGQVWRSPGGDRVEITGVDTKHNILAFRDLDTQAEGGTGILSFRQRWTLEPKVGDGDFSTRGELRVDDVALDALVEFTFTEHRTPVYTDKSPRPVDWIDEGDEVQVQLRASTRDPEKVRKLLDAIAQRRERIVGTAAEPK